jgi:two-component system, NarL family, response regulator LiaR
MSAPIRVLIADDHAIIREGLRTLIERIPDLDLVGEATDGDDAVRQTLSLRPDLILLDLRMPGKDGLKVIAEIRVHNPDVSILVLTSFDDDDYVLAAIKGGAQGYLLKDVNPEHLVQAIRDVSRGESALHPTIARKVLQELSRPPEQTPAHSALTEREVEVLRLIAQGLSNQEIAHRLMIGERTAATHVRNILAKLDLVSRTQAALYAIRSGLADLNQP